MSARTCPICRNAKSVVRQTSFDKGGNLTRYRRCDKCGATWRTIEIDYDDYVRVAATIETITDAVKKGGALDE